MLGFLSVLDRCVKKALWMFAGVLLSISGWDDLNNILKYPRNTLKIQLIKHSSYQLNSEEFLVMHSGKYPAPHSSATPIIEHGYVSEQCLERDISVLLGPWHLTYVAHRNGSLHPSTSLLPKQSCMTSLLGPTA